MMEDHQALLMNTDGDEGLGFGEEGLDAKDRLRHPIVAFFHVFFRAAAIIVYMLCGWTGAGFVPSFVTVVILLSLDFWTVKNITGRTLVGLRWWNYVDDDGISHWVFESRKGARAGGRPQERRVFWGALILAPVVWFFLFMSSFFTFRFQWTILVVLAMALSGANLYGYIRCKLGHKPGIADATGILHSGLQNVIFNRATSATTTDATAQAFTAPAHVV
ncbi:unnamed protein product [Orchesella dallaii]|uniref:Golgi apparatus membrane protein TVP23 homolog n=1 Tax=Orchesella dallaii TaxID=48710 RepID=A0ABP1QY14_9HEXA